MEIFVSQPFKLSHRRFSARDYEIDKASYYYFDNNNSSSQDFVFFQMSKITSCPKVFNRADI